MNPNWRNRYEVMVDAARQAGRFAMGYFDREVAIQWKADQSPVTVADQGAEHLLRTTLLGRFPTDGFLGEESGSVPGESGYRWIIDPIDGTRNFVRGIPIWATLVGLEYRGEVIASVAEAPAMGQTFHALRGHGAFRGERRLLVSTVANLDEAHVYYSSLTWFAQAGRETQFLNLLRSTQRQRGFGDFYGFILVAQGSGELMIDHGVHAWDLGGLVAIIEEAGGKITAWDGKYNIERSDVVASNGLVHEAALMMLNA
ncbi:MAG: histidinol phosphate phosphatase [Gemmataceae bacterium]|nr:histidinol phosphate phosphatase [Gemmataceae bacterium]